jgi:hypothetical protein
MPLGARPGPSPQLRELKQTIRRLLRLDDDHANTRRAPRRAHPRHRTDRLPRLRHAASAPRPPPRRRSHTFRRPPRRAYLTMIIVC